MNKSKLLLLSMVGMLTMGLLVFSAAYHPSDSVSIEKGTLQESLNNMVMGVKPLYAASPSAAWEYVRGTATFVKTVSTGVSTIMQQINSSGLLMLDSYNGTVPGTSYKLSFLGNANVTISNGALGSSTYAKRLYLWNSSGEKLIELFFGATGSTTGTNVLVRFMPSRLDPTVSSTGIVECQVQGATGSRVMVCSLSGGPFNTTVTPQWSTAIIKAQEDSGTMKITALSKTANAFAPGGPCGSGIYYFPLAYIVKNVSPYYTTAEFGFNINEISTRICDGSLVNNYNKGLFNTNANSSVSISDTSKYFVAEGQTNAQIASTYTEYPSGADVDTLFATITSGTDYVSKTNLDTLSVPANNKQFYDSSAPTF